MASKERVECGYCGAEVRRDILKNHTQSKHAGCPVKEKGWGNISSFMMPSSKRQRLDVGAVSGTSASGSGAIGESSAGRSVGSTDSTILDLTVTSAEG